MSRQLLVELYEMLENEPDSVELREIILEQWIQLGERDPASGIAKELLKLDPSNAGAANFEKSTRMAEQEKKTWNPLSPRRSGQQSRHSLQSQTNSQQDEPEKQPQSWKSGRINPAQPPRSEAERANMEAAFERDYRRLVGKAAELNDEMLTLQAVRHFKDDEEMVSNLQGIVSGHISAVVSRCPPRPIRELARELRDKSAEESLNIIIDDYNEVVQWELAENPSLDGEMVRTRLRKRQQILEASVPAATQTQSREALMHVEHELKPPLGRRYENTETMLGDEVAAVPRAAFLATEDNYAWDMSELASALEANGGVMRNPLSRELFSADDVRAIMAHPLGRRLGPQAQEQEDMKRGVRGETVVRIQELGAVMLEDQSADAVEAMQAVDEFLTFMATLPRAEQRVLDVLKVPAVDGHTGQAYDFTIGEAVRDAKANRTCFHKSGDFLVQATKYLLSAPAETEPPKAPQVCAAA